MKRIVRVSWWDKCVRGQPRFMIIFVDGSSMSWHECDNKVRCHYC